ncbi:Hypothetical protein D9617_71g039820 [Elsinoe fawcettii]|nr:Hypothetical protein D9617_71g039820 [Elsinoe fawcettii]
MDILQLNKALQKLNRTERVPVDKNWTPYHEFALRCNNDPNIIARARSWIAEQTYWEQENRHFQLLVRLLRNMDEEDGIGGIAPFPQMNELEDVFHKYKKGVSEALALRNIVSNRGKSSARNRSSMTSAAEVASIKRTSRGIAARTPQHNVNSSLAVPFETQTAQLDLDSFQYITPLDVADLGLDLLPDVSNSYVIDDCTDWMLASAQGQMGNVTHPFSPTNQALAEVIPEGPSAEDYMVLAHDAPTCVNIGRTQCSQCLDSKISSIYCDFSRFVDMPVFSKWMARSYARQMEWKSIRRSTDRTIPILCHERNGPTYSISCRGFTPKFPEETLLHYKSSGIWQTLETAAYAVDGMVHLDGYVSECVAYYTSCQDIPWLEYISSTTSNLAAKEELALAFKLYVASRLLMKGWSIAPISDTLGTPEISDLSAPLHGTIPAPKVMQNRLDHALELYILYAGCGNCRTRCANGTQLTV